MQGFGNADWLRRFVRDLTELAARDDLDRGERERRIDAIRNRIGGDTTPADLPEGPLTRDGFEDLRNAAYRRQRAERDSPITRPDWRLPAIETVDPPAAGTWLRPRCSDQRGHCSDHPDGWDTTRWHLFEGDLLWGPGRDRATLTMACGFVFSPGGRIGIIRDKPGYARLSKQPATACKRCLSAVRRAMVALEA